MKASIVLLLAMIVAAPLGIVVGHAQATHTPPIPRPVHYMRVTVPIPEPAARAGAVLIIGGPPGFILYNDLDLNGAPGEGEKVGQAPLQGDLGLVRLEVSGSNAVALPLLSTSRVWGLVYALLPGGGAISYSIPLPGTRLLAPPLPGELLVAPEGNRTARVLVGGLVFTVHPGEVLRVRKPQGVTLVIANTSIVGLLYNATGGEAWATELVPANMSYTPVLSLSEATASLLGGPCRVEIVVVGVNGNYTVYNASRIFTAVAVPGVKGVVYYMVYGCGGVGVAPLYPSIASKWPRPGMLPLESRGVGGGPYLVSLPSGVPSSVLFADIDGDGDYDVIITREPGDVPVIDGRGLAGGMVVSRGEAPLVLEEAGGGLLLYAIIYPSASLTPPSGILGEITGESLNMVSQVRGGTLTLTVDISPRTGIGGVTRAIAALLDPALRPIEGTFRELAPSNTSRGLLEAHIDAPIDDVGSGFYLVYLILYQKGIGYGVSFRGPPPLQSFSKVELPAGHSEAVGGSVKSSAYSVRFALVGHWDAPTLRDVDFKSLASLLVHAQAPRTIYQTVGNVENILVNGTAESSSRPPLAPLIVAVLALVAAIAAVLRLYRGE